MGKGTIRNVAENATEIIDKIKTRIGELENQLANDATPEEKKAWRGEWLKLIEEWRDVTRLLLDSEGYLELEKDVAKLKEELQQG